MNKKGQGTIEYLVMIGIIIVIALLVVGLLSGFLEPAEIILIVVVIAIFFFGKDKVLDWARTVGQAKKEFNEGAKGNTKKKKTKKKKK